MAHRLTASREPPLPDPDTDAPLPAAEAPPSEQLRGNEGQPGTARLEAFSDNVMGVILTIMIFTIQPQGADALAQGWPAFLKGEAPKFASFAVSFVTIAILWINHHQVLPTAPKSTPRLMWWNMNVLFWMSLIPVGTYLLGEHPTRPFAVAFYAAIQFTVSVSFAMLRRYVSCLRPDLKTHHTRMMQRSLIGAAINLSATGLAFVAPLAALPLLLIPPAMFFLPHPLPPGAVVEG